MSRVLLLDTSFAARPIHEWLLAEGFEVWVIGNRPADPLAMYDPRFYICESYADVAVVQTHVDRLGIDYVVPGCTDVSIETAARLRLPERLTDAADVHERLGNKGRFRALCADLDLPAPKRMNDADFPRPGRFIAKPVDAYSGRGITVFDGLDAAAASSAMDHARRESRTGEALAETFVEGELHSHSAFLESGRVAYAAIVNEAGSVSPYAVDTSFVVHDFPATGRAALDSAIEAVAAELDLVDGLIHTQFIWDGAAPSIIEMGRRCPGDLYPRLVELGTGVPHASWYAAAFVGRNRPEPSARVPREIIRHTLTAGHGFYAGIFFDHAMPVCEFHPVMPVGRQIPSRSTIDRVGLVFAAYNTRAALMEARGEFMRRAVYSAATRKDGGQNRSSQSNRSFAVSSATQSKVG